MFILLYLSNHRFLNILIRLFQIYRKRSPRALFVNACYLYKCALYLLELAYTKFIFSYPPNKKAKMPSPNKCARIISHISHMFTFLIF